MAISIHRNEEKELYVTRKSLGVGNGVGYQITVKDIWIDLNEEQFFQLCDDCYRERIDAKM